jgi:peptidoglycan/LPS O-acetylase OafA/YrhL
MRDETIPHERDILFLQWNSFMAEVYRIRALRKKRLPVWMTVLGLMGYAGLATLFYSNADSTTAIWAHVLMILNCVVFSYLILRPHLILKKDLEVANLVAETLFLRKKETASGG